MTLFVELGCMCVIAFGFFGWIFCGEISSQEMLNRILISCTVFLLLMTVLNIDNHGEEKKCECGQAISNTWSYCANCGKEIVNDAD